MDEDETPLQRLLANVKAKSADAYKQVDALADDAEPISDSERVVADRLIWILRAAQAHSQGVMPWRANPPTPVDADWVDQVCNAVRDRRARPEHPEDEIEQILLNALPT